MQGGKFGHGFASSAFTKFAGTSGLIPGNEGEFSARRLIGHAVVGGTASLSGGKFANGAQNGAYGYLFNEIGLRGGKDANKNKRTWADIIDENIVKLTTSDDGVLKMIYSGPGEDLETVNITKEGNLISIDDPRVGNFTFNYSLLSKNEIK